MLAFEQLYSDEFVNYLGDEGIEDYNPALLTRGINHTQEYSKINLNYNQDLFVNMIMGNLIYKRLDYFLYDIGIPIIIEFTYNSGSSFRGRYGNGWQFSYNIRYVENNFNDNIILIESDDRSNLFNINDSINTSYNPIYKLSKNETAYSIINYRNNYFKDNDYIKYNFDIPIYHYITSIEDRNNNKVNLFYNIEKQLISIKFQSGKSISLFYDNNNLLSHITIPEFGDINYIYDKNNNLIKVIYPNGNKVEYQYSDNCNLIKNIINDRDTLSVRYTDNNLVDSIYKSNSDWHYKYDYDFEKRMNRIIDDFGKSIQFKYDSLYRIIELYKYGLLVKKIQWDSLNQIIEFTNAINQKYRYSYSDNGIISNYISPENKVIKIKTDDKYKRVYQYSINNSVLYYELDNKSNIIAFYRNNERDRMYGYDIWGQLVSYEDNKNKYKLLYDGFGNYKRLIINEDLEFSFDYDFFNNLNKIAEIGQFILSAKYNYNLNSINIENTYNHINKEIFYNSNLLIDSINHKNQYFEKFIYDNSRRLVGYKYDNLFNLKFDYYNDSIISVNTPIFKYQISYDYANNLKQIINRYNYKYKYKYDRMGRLIEHSINDNYIFQKVYNSESLLKNIVLPNGINIEVMYDELDRISKIIIPNNRQLNYLWDNHNRLVSYIDNNQSYKFIYNDNGYSTQLPSGKVFIFNESNRKREVSYLDFLYTINYDRYHRVESIYRNNVEIAKYIYDNNLIQNIILNGNNKLNYNYNENSLLNSITNTDTVLAVFTYDKYGRINNLQTGNYSTSIIYDNYNRIKNIIRNNSLITNFDYNNYELIINKNQVDYKYEFMNYHLVNVINPNYDKLLFTYDNKFLLNKIVSPEGGFVSLEYNNINKINNIIDSYNKKSSLNYDDMGHLSSIINKNSFSQSFKYNADGNLIEYTDLNNSITNIYYNDYFMITKILFNNSELQSFQYNENQYLANIKYFNGLNVYYIRDEYGRILKLYDNNDTISFNYNYRNCLISSTFNSIFHLDYIYDKNMRINNIILNDSVKLMFNYDNYYRLNKVLIGKDELMNLNWDNNNNLIYTNIIGSYPTTYSYNTLGLVSECNSDTYIKNNYDKLGRLFQRVYGNGRKESYTFDANSRVSSKIDFLNNEYYYDYDNIGNILSVKINRLDSLQFNYNPMGRLANISINNKQFFHYEYKNNLLSDIYDFNNKHLQFKWTNSNFNTLLVNFNSISDSVLLDIDFRIKQFNDKYQYTHFGLESQINANKFNYDNYARKTIDKSKNIDNIKYNGNSYYPDNIQYYDNIIDFRYINFNKPSLLRIKSDTFQLNYNNFVNSYSLSKNSKYIFEYFGDIFGNYSYQFNLINNINKQGDQSIAYGIDGKALQLDYNYIGNIKSIIIGNNQLYNFKFDDFGNLSSTEDAEGNHIQYSYLGDKVSEINYSNGKFTEFKYNDKGELEKSFSNSVLNDSIVFTKGVSSNNFTYRYFTKKFNIYSENNNYKFKFDDKVYSLFQISSFNSLSSFKFDNLNYVLNKNNSISFKDIAISYKISFDKIEQLVKKLDSINVVVDNINYNSDLKSTILNNDTLFSVESDILNRSVSIKSNDTNTYTFKYDNQNNINQILRNDKLAQYNYEQGFVTINDKKYVLSPNRNISRIIQNDDTISLFYDYEDRLQDYINKSKNIKFLYNSIGEMSAIIDVDTTYLFHIVIDSVDIRIILNSNKKKLDVYLMKQNNYKFPIFKYDIINKKEQCLIRNSSGFPILLIDNLGDLNTIDNRDIFGVMGLANKDFVYFYKDYYYDESINLFISKDIVFDPINLIKYNKRVNNDLNELATLKIFDISNTHIILNKNNLNLNLNIDDLMYNTSPLYEDFQNLINNIKNRYIKLDIDSIFNSFKVFNLATKLNPEKKPDIQEIASIDNYLPNINKILSNYNPELIIYPIFPDELSDTILINNLNDNYVGDYKLHNVKNDRIKQIYDFLHLTELDTNFVLYCKLKDFNNLYSEPTIQYPTNIVELTLNNINTDDINMFNNPNEIIKINSKYQNKQLYQDTAINQIMTLLKYDVQTNTDLINRPFYINNNLDFNNNLLNNFLPINLQILQDIPNDNLKSLLKLIRFPTSKKQIPSQILYNNKYIDIPIDNSLYKLNFLKKNYQGIK